MKIQRIEANGFLGARNIIVDTQAPIQLFAGGNYAGKSSLRAAVRMALTGEPERVALKKDYGRMVTDGNKVGYAVVDFDGGRATITLPKGQHASDYAHPALSYVIDAQKMMELDNEKRRAFLFGVMGVRASAKIIIERLTAKECDPALIKEITPHLAAGFAGAAEEAEKIAREQKTEWKAATGGATWGSLVGATWAAARPEYDQAALEQKQADINVLTEEIAIANASIGEKTGALRAFTTYSTRISELRESATMIPRLEAKLVADTAERDRMQALCDETAEQAGTRSPADPVAIACPCCGGALMDTPAGLVEWKAVEKLPYDADAAAKLPEYLRALALTKSALTNTQTALDNAKNAQADIEAIESAAPEAVDSAEIDRLRERVRTVTQSRAALEAEIASLKADKEKADSADLRTVNAAAAHKKIMGWIAIKDQLLPDGIPADLLREAIEPINSRLLASAEITEWISVRLNDDMELVTTAGRSYDLFSVSEKWRADAMLAEAISFYTGIRLLVLDGMDVLQVEDRSALLWWVEQIYQQGELDTALIFGTFKQKPSGLSECIDAHWIQNGELIATIAEEGVAA